MNAANESRPAAPTLDGYDVFECIGVGGLGAVYRAQQRSTGMEVAVKLVRSSGDPADGWRRTERELRALAGLRGHANVVGVLEVVAAGEFRALVVDYAPGGSVNELVAASGPLDVGEIIFVGRQVAHALEAAHERGIVHRDIKPHNLLIDDFGQIKVCDFGVASLLGEDEFRDRTSGLSVRFASPEDVEDEPDVLGPPSDIYSLGATLLFLRRGAPPTTLERVAGWVPPVAADDDLGSRLDAVIAECLRLDPLERPTARALHDEFQNLEALLPSPVVGLALDDDADGSDDAHVGESPLAPGADDDPADEIADDTIPPSAAAVGSADAEPDLVDTTMDREMRAEFQAAIRTGPPVTSRRTDVLARGAGRSTSDTTHHPDGPDSEPVLIRPEAARSIERRALVGPVVAVVMLVVVAVAIWAFGLRDRDSRSDQAVAPPVPTAPAVTVVGTIAPTGQPVTTVDPGRTVEVVERPDALDDLAAVGWPLAERGGCVVQRPDLAELVATPCDTPHDLQSLGFETVTDGDPTLDDAAIGELAGSVCTRLADGVATFVGSDDLTVEATVPSAASWAAGDRVVQCWLRIPGQRLVGDALS